MVGCVYMVGVCMVSGVHGRGACMAGGVHGRRGMHGGGACLAGGGGHAWQILRDMLNEWAVRILLECILVGHICSGFNSVEPRSCEHNPLMVLFH